MKNLTLDCVPFPGVHNAPAICTKVTEVLKKYHLDSNEVSKYITSDNAANMKKALTEHDTEALSFCDDNDKDENEESHSDRGNEEKKLVWSHICCFNHTLQLAITGTKKELGAHTVIDKVSSHVGRYNKSQPAREGLTHFQKELNLPQHSLIQTVATRWDGDFYMLERYEEQKLAIISEQARAGVDSLSNKEWLLVSGYVVVLKSIVLFTAEMGSSKKPTLSMVIPALFEIQSSLKDFIKKAPRGTGITFARALLANVEARFPDSEYLNSELYRTAMIVNPKFKAVLTNNFQATSLLEKKATDKFRQHIKRGIKSSSSIHTSEDVAERSNLNEPEPSQQNSNAVKWSHFKKKAMQAKATCDIPDELDTIKKEVETYLSEPPIDGDALEWWKDNKDRFPYLAPVAQHHLGLGSSETASERVFSVGGNVVTSKRTSLLPEHVQEMVFCHDNASLI